VVDCSSDEVLTDQSQAQQCDINLIVARYQKTGQLPPFREGAYLDVSEFSDYQESLNRAHALEEYFGSLPAKMRERYGNSPALFLHGIQTPEGYDDAVELGLIRKDEPPAPGPVLVVDPVKAPEASKPV